MMKRLDPRRLIMLLAAGLSCLALVTLSLTWTRLVTPSDPLNSAEDRGFNHEPIYEFQVSDDGSRYLARARGRGIVLRNLDDHRQTAEYSNTGLRLTAFCASPDWSCFVSVDDNGNVDISTQSGDRFQTRRLCNLGTTAINCSISRDGTLAAFACDDGHVDVRELSTGRRRFRLRCSDDLVNVVRFSPTSDELVAVTSDGRMTLWNSRSGDHLRDFVLGRMRPLCLEFSPDGQRLVAGGLVGEIGIWDRGQSSPLRMIDSGGVNVVSLAVSRNGNRIAAGSFMGTVSLWETATGHACGKIEVESNAIFDLQFAKNDSALYFAGSQAGFCRVEIASFAAPVHSPEMAE